MSAQALPKCGINRLAGGAVLAAGLLGGTASAQQAALVTDLSDHLISITSSFSGTDLLLFGAVDGGPGDIVVVVRGPELPVVMRRKDRVAGIWVNRVSEEFKGVPAYYAMASNRVLRDIASDTLLARLQIGLDNLRFEPADDLSDAELQIFSDAIVRAKLREGLYRLEIAKVNFLGEKLFRTRIQFPANVPVGNYIVQVYLMRDGRVVGAQTTPLFIKKFGIERAIFDFAHNQPIIYGIAAVVLALLAGWAAGVIFRRP